MEHDGITDTGGVFINPFAMDESNPDILWTGANRPFGAAVDQSFIYWTNYNGNTIGRATLDGNGGAPERFEIDVVVSRDDGAVGKGLRIDGDDFAHDESGAATGARREKVDPALGDAVPGAVVCQRRWKRDAIADLTVADPNGGE